VSLFINLIPGAVLKFTIDKTTYSLSNYEIFSGTVGIFGYTDGSYATTTYGYVNYITHDGAGNLYIGDHNTGAKSGIDGIRRLSAQNGNVTTLAGKTDCDVQPNLLTSGENWCYGDGVTPGPLTFQNIPNNWPPLQQSGRIAQFNYQTGLAVTNYGNLMYVADTSQNLIRQIYCAAGYNLTFGQCVGSTKQPSHNPTFSPTLAPSDNPTVAPTDTPTQFPTLPPTESPTQSPTQSPTNAPTNDCQSALSYVKTPCGNGCPTSCDGAEFKASVHAPFGVVLSKDETYVIIADYGGNSLRKLVVSSGYVTTIVSGKFNSGVNKLQELFKYE